MTTTTAAPSTGTRPRMESRIDVKLRLSAMWTTMLLIFAYVDIFSLFRADVLEAALDGRMATTGFVINQNFLMATLGYILVAVLMVTLSVVLRARINRIITIVVALVYALTIIASCIGETWGYYLAGSAVEVALLLVIVATAVRWR